MFFSFLLSIADFYGWLKIIGSMVGAIVTYRLFRKKLLKKKALTKTVFLKKKSLLKL
jgi:hypothetical protein